MLSESISTVYSTIFYQDIIYQINYYHPRSSVPIFFVNPLPPHRHIRLYSGSSANLNSVQLFPSMIPDHPPSVEQITSCNQILYLLIIPQYPIRIPYPRLNIKPPLSVPIFVHLPPPHLSLPIAYPTPVHHET